MGFCKSCGGQLPDGANNCPHCGAPIIGAAQQSYQQNNQQNNQQHNYQQANFGGSTEAFLGKDHTGEYDPGDRNANKVTCGFAYIPILFWLPLVTGNTPYCKFHANQGLLMLIFGVAVSVVSSVIGALWAIPFAGSLFSALAGIISALGSLCELGMMIYGMVNTFAYAKAVELPLIGRINLIK
ncbi:MAG: zinc ribbon domain-containing protein [Ruminiclostridium sp.]|nr:zinc ribbon domain-containing protein [Ruminiclostridium sp.]